MMIANHLAIHQTHKERVIFMKGEFI